MIGLCPVRRQEVMGGKLLRGQRHSFFKEMQDLFLPYGYKLTSGGFPDEHQQVLAGEQLTAIGKNADLVIPVPNATFVLTKIK